MAFCTKCGAKINEGVRFCTGCGNAVGGAPVAANAGNVKQAQTINAVTPKNNTQRNVIIVAGVVLAFIFFGLPPLLINSASNDNYDGDDYGKAITKCNIAFALNPFEGYWEFFDMAGAIYNTRGQSYLRAGQYDKAISDFNKELDTCRRLDNYPISLAWPYSMIGKTYLAKGQYDEALKYYDEAIRLNARHTDYYYGRGQVYRQLGNTTKAIQDFENVLRINSVDAEAKQALQEIRGY